MHPIIVDEGIYRDPLSKGRFGTVIPYRINVNHPVIRPMYDAYRRRHNLPLHCPLSDRDRFAFEDFILRAVADGKIAVK